MKRKERPCTEADCETLTRTSFSKLIRATEALAERVCTLESDMVLLKTVMVRMLDPGKVQDIIGEIEKVLAEEEAE
jgi:hypothetical protein